MRFRQVLLALGVLTLIATFTAVLAWPLTGPSAAAGTNSITSPDTVGNVGRGAFVRDREV